MVQTPTRLDRYQSDFQALEQSQAPDGPPWLAQLRRRAFSRFEALGFPTARRGNEKWKYTSVAPIARASFAYALEGGSASVSASQLRSRAPWDDSWATLVFVNGRFAESLSTPLGEADGVHVAGLARAIASNGHVVERHLGRCADFEEDAFAALNTAFIVDGAFVHLSAGATPSRAVHLVFVSAGGGERPVSYPRTLVVAGEGARATVVESYLGLSDAPYFTDAATEVSLQAGAQVEHYRYLMESPQAYHVGRTHVYQGPDSTFSSTAFMRGAAVARSEMHVKLDAPGSSCFLKGLYMTLGGEHMDNHINVDHLKPHCTSDQYFKGILGGTSRAVYSGRVVVHRDAQKTNAYQRDHNLILSAGAEVDTKPSLEIYADDVKCGHGATAGAVAHDAVFYLQSRGLDLQTARRLLIHGFASEVIEGVSLASLREHLDRVFSASIPDAEFGDAA